MSNSVVDSNSFEFKNADPLMLAAAASVFDGNIKFGTYEGNAVYIGGEQIGDQTINLGGRPKAVIVAGGGYNFVSGSNNIIEGGIFFDGYPLEDGDLKYLEIIDNGFVARMDYPTHSRPHVNSANFGAYYYLAIM